MSEPNIDRGLFVNYVLSMLLKKIIVPSGYRDQIAVIKEMLADDVSGLVDSLTDFSVSTASVDFDIETDNEVFTGKLRSWLDKINMDYNGQIPTGIKPLAKEYFKERWKYSSFPILKIAKWGSVNGIMVPTRMYFVDSASVYAEDKDETDQNLKLINYNYYLGSNKKYKLDKGTIFSRPYGRWFDKYPTPYLIKRGIYHNWRIIQSLKNKETEILDQVIPYFMMIKKGSENLALQDKKVYNNAELQATIEQFQDLMDKVKTTNISESSNDTVRTPMRATQFDEEVKHIIPDLSTIFDGKLFATAEKNILSGLGFIDVVEATSTSRRESILNPKGFIEEVKDGVEGFKQILKHLVNQIVEKNKSHRKYVNSEFYISSSPVKGFITSEFKQQTYKLWRAGRLSDRTAIDLIAEADFRTEVYRRKKEKKQDLQSTFYPPVTQNVEKDVAPDDPRKKEVKEEDTLDRKIPDDKKDEDRKEEYTESKEDDLVTAPYNKISELPDRVKNNMSESLQKTYLKVFNEAYEQYHDDSKASATAWKIVKKKGRKNKKGIWVRK